MSILKKKSFWGFVIGVVCVYLRIHFGADFLPFNVFWAVLLILACLLWLAASAFNWLIDQSDHDWRSPDKKRQDEHKEILAAQKKQNELLATQLAAQKEQNELLAAKLAAQKEK